MTLCTIRLKVTLRPMTLVKCSQLQSGLSFHCHLPRWVSASSSNQCDGTTKSNSIFKCLMDLDLDLYIAGTILAIFAMELGERNANKTCI